jgi:hypothetical protein
MYTRLISEEKKICKNSSDPVYSGPKSLSLAKSFVIFWKGKEKKKKSKNAPL